MDAYVLMNLIPYHPIVLIFECSEELSKWMKIICLEPAPIQWPAAFRLEDRLPVDKWRGGIFPILYNHNNTLGARYFDPHFSVVISIGRILAAIGDELQSARTNGIEEQMDEKGVISGSDSWQIQVRILWILCHQTETRDVFEWRHRYDKIELGSCLVSNLQTLSRPLSSPPKAAT